MGLSPAAVIYDSSGNPVSIVADGGVYRISGLTKVLDSGGSQINPATEGTLTSVDSWLGIIDGTLDSIKDTDGIKKVTDPVKAKTGPAGGSFLEGIDVSSELVRLKATLYSQDGDPIAFGSVAPNPESIKNDFVKSGGSENLLVDGDPTPVVFTYNADPTHDISILEVKFVLAANGITFGTGYFGATSGPLANGLKVEVTSNGNTGTVAILKQNEDFVHFASPGGFEWVVSSKDMMSSLWLVGGGLKLYAGTSDNIKVTVQDDIDSAGVYFQCFVKGNILA